jgi:hypothetical protein
MIVQIFSFFFFISSEKIREGSCAFYHRGGEKKGWHNSLSGADKIYLPIDTLFLHGVWPFLKRRYLFISFLPDYIKTRPHLYIFSN